MLPETILRVRRFNRAVTSGLGALDSSFLGRGRPLGAARVLNAIGHGHTDVGALRAYLGLDSGQVSRLLRGLEAERLVATRPDAQDGRRRVAGLTEAGRREFDAYEALSNAQAAEILAAHPDPTGVLDAMDLLASVFGRDRVTITAADPTAPQSRSCLDRYYAELAQRFRHGFDVNLSRDPDAADMVPPRGGFFLALSDGLAVACVGLKGSVGPVAEVKRLWVAPHARGLGLARRLMAAVEDTARDLGITTLRLDTNSALPEAERLYRRSGWTEIPRFNDDPYPDLFFEKHL